MGFGLFKNLGKLPICAGPSAQSLHAVADAAVVQPAVGLRDFSQLHPAAMPRQIQRHIAPAVSVAVSKLFPPLPLELLDDPHCLRPARPLPQPP